jgi:hypothetical protein
MEASSITQLTLDIDNEISEEAAGKAPEAGVHYCDGESLDASPLVFEQVTDLEGFSAIRESAPCELCGNVLVKGELAYRSTNTGGCPRCARCHLSRHNSWRIDTAIAQARREAILSVIASGGVDSTQLEEWFGRLWGQDIRAMQAAGITLSVKKDVRNGHEFKSFTLLDEIPHHPNDGVVDREVDSAQGAMRRAAAIALMRAFFEGNGHATRQFGQETLLEEGFEAQIGGVWHSFQVVCQESNEVPNVVSDYLVLISRKGIRIASAEDIVDKNTLALTSDHIADRLEIVSDREKGVMQCNQISAMVFAEWTPEMMFEE